MRDNNMVVLPAAGADRLSRRKGIIMKIFATALARLASLTLLLMLCAGPALAQFSQLEGLVLNQDAKPFPDVTIVIKHRDTGQVMETKTDAKGEFVVAGARIGIWDLTVKVKGNEAWHQPVKVSTGGQEKVIINFKELLAKQSAEEAAARKKAEEDAAKFAGLKSHFEAGRAQLEQAINTKNELIKLPATERGPLTEKLMATSQSAITEFEAAKSSATENDTNLHIVMFNLGQAYDLGGRYDEAVAAYTKAIELKGEIAGYYPPYGTVLAKAGKVSEAMAACEKVGTLPGVADAVQTSATCYGNVGITLQNGAKMKESIEPLKKALELSPTYADYWFLLARGLTNAMESKMEGGKMVAIVQPGTVEAYQKYLEMAPTGRFAQEAKDGLEMLKALGAGIETKVTTKKAKKP
jgi:tetratricopeptide (TPR) repeat protein